MEKLNLERLDKSILTNFCNALTNLKEPLPQDIQTEVNQVGAALAAGDATAADKLEEIAYSYAPLEEQYDKIATIEQEKYHSQELNKGIPPRQKPIDIEEPVIISNYILVLNAPNSVKEAQEKAEEEEENNQ